MQNYYVWSMNNPLLKIHSTTENCYCLLSLFVNNENISRCRSRLEKVRFWFEKFYIIKKLDKIYGTDCFNVSSRCIS